MKKSGRLPNMELDARWGLLMSNILLIIRNGGLNVDMKLRDGTTKIEKKDRLKKEVVRRS